MKNINNVVLLGKVADEPYVTDTMTAFRVAVTEVGSDGNEHTSQISVSASGRCAKAAAKLSKDDRVIVVGRFKVKGSNGKTYYDVVPAVVVPAEGDVNYAEIQGNLTDDPRIGVTYGGSNFANMTVACHNDYKSGDELVSNTSFVPVTYWDKLNQEDPYRKGSPVIVEGKLVNRSYDNKDGQRVYVTNLNADSVSHYEFTKKAAVQTKEPMADGSKADEAKVDRPAPLDSNDDDELDDLPF